MSKRLQVLLSESDWRELQRAPRSQGTTVADWVRKALRAARRVESHGDAGRKLDAIRAAARHEYPVADVQKMLEEIERGYLRN